MLLKIWPILIFIFLTSLPSFASRQELDKCQQYLLKAPVEYQSGLTCELYAFKNLLEGLCQKKLSSEYAMLAFAAAKIEEYVDWLDQRDVRVETLRRAYRRFPWLSIKPLNALGAFQKFGVLPEAEFSDNQVKKRFMESFEVPLTAGNIYAIFEADMKLLEDAISKLSDDMSESEKENTIKAFMNEAMRFMKFVNFYRDKAKQFWLNKYGNYVFNLNFSQTSEEANSWTSYYKESVFPYIPNSKSILISIMSDDFFRQSTLRNLHDGLPMVIFDEKHAKLAIGAMPDLGGWIIFFRDSAVPNILSPNQTNSVQAESYDLIRSKYVGSIVPKLKKDVTAK